MSEPRADGGETIVYDGECAFCRKQVERIRGWDRAERFAYLPRQSPDLETRFPQLAQADLASGMRLVEPDGTVLVGADAVHGIARRLPGWRYLAWLYRVPGLRWLARRAYGWIAANRYKLAGSCDDGACDLPAGEGREDVSARNPGS